MNDSCSLFHKFIRLIRSILHILLFIFLWILLGLWISNDQLHKTFSFRTFVQINMNYWYKIFTFIAFIQCITFTLFFATLHSIYLILHYKNFLQGLELKNLPKLYSFITSFDFVLSLTFVYINGTLLCFFGYIIGYNQRQEIIFSLYGYGITGILVFYTVLMSFNNLLIKKKQRTFGVCCDEEETL
uniref:Transmembrane protein n=1 Tax=Strongyloides venezuelensis TaxID=75913 RepID=A0A0K0FVT3_STRVS